MQVQENQDLRSSVGKNVFSMLTRGVDYCGKWLKFSCPIPNHAHKIIFPLYVHHQTLKNSKRFTTDKNKTCQMDLFVFLVLLAIYAHIIITCLTSNGVLAGHTINHESR